MSVLELSAPVPRKFIGSSMYDKHGDEDNHTVDLTERFLHGERVYDGKLLKVHRDTVAMPNGHEEVREVIRHCGASVIVPHLGDDRYVLVRQYRYALGRETLEFPAGRLDPGEEPLDSARRELKEETGYLATRWEELFQIHPAPGYSDERLWIYLAEDLQAGQNSPDPDELVLVVEMSLDEILRRLKKGEITDSKTVAALLYLQVLV